MDSPKQKQKTWKIIKLRPKCFAPIIYLRDTIKISIETGGNWKVSTGNLMAKTSYIVLYIYTAHLYKVAFGSLIQTDNRF